MRKEKAAEDPNKKEYATLQNLWFILGTTFKNDHKLILFFSMLCICEASLSFVWVYFSKAVIAQVERGAEINRFIITVSIAAAVQLIFTFGNGYANSQVWWRYVRGRMYFLGICNKKTLTMDFENLESPKMLDIREKAMRTCGGNEDGVEGSMRTAQNIVCRFIQLLVASVVLLKVNMVLVVIIAVLAIINYFIIDYAKKHDKKNVWDPLIPHWRKINYMNNAVSDFTSAKDIRIYAMKDWFIQKHREVNRAVHLKVSLSKKTWIIAGIISHLTLLLQEIALYIWLIYSVLYSGMPISDFVLYLGLMRTFFSSAFFMMESSSELRKKSRDINDFRTFLEYPDEPCKNLPLPEITQYCFTFENVSFKYRGSETYALKNMNLTLKSGERLAVVGLNGAGKTTFVKLLLRLYKPTEGRILLNGADVSEYDKNEYFKLFSPLFQDVQLFAFPLSENVSMKAPFETESKRAEECLILAGFGEKLKALPKGSATEILKVLYDDGIDLSGGEKQKLALARALYKDSPVIILDEPTSALDALAEYELYNNFDTLIKNKTAIYISHRLSSTRFCDKVAMFKDGGLAEYGTHEELMGLSGAYCELFSVQAQYYIDGDGGKNYA